MNDTWGAWFYRRPTNPPNQKTALREWLGGSDSKEIVNLKIPWGLWFYRCIFRKRANVSRIITIKVSTPCAAGCRCAWAISPANAPWKQSCSRRAKSRLRREQAEVVAQLQPLQKPFLPEVVARVEDWAKQYSILDSRYKFLVLRAPSRAGKSTLAKCLHFVLPTYIQKPPFIQTVQGATAAELQHYDRDSHGFILFDNCNSMSFVLSQRALFQANPDFHRLGQSQTNIFSYQVCLFRVPIVITIDESTDWDDDEPWIRENQHLVQLTGPCYHLE